LLQESTSTTHQQERHVLYVEKKARSRKKPVANVNQAAPAQMHTTTPVQMQQPPVQLHQAPVQRPFVPPKKKQTVATDAPGQSTSQPVSQESYATQIPRSRRRETISMSDVVTEQVPKKGRLKWYMLGNENRGQGVDAEE
jgi:hypothetical protein